MRADEAGVELAKALLQSEEHKPITLVGYSFGARIIYSCLKELARRQELWETQKEGESCEGEGGGNHKYTQNEQHENEQKEREHPPNGRQQQKESSTESPSASLNGLIANARTMVRQKRASLRSPSDAKKADSTNACHTTFSREPASIIEDVVVMGLPQFIDLQSWLEIR
eukprot:CAMPEP_0178713882 /NCGR_PEP_ID=MMETSP0699-20121125/19711_1 /TAXON_ID=265572 /ORGANISM="Extubocellulus spinifer, Strain CCMP396" /LENGTH=169 /DNA_ID=CAMNT_0020362847 /DNA_START=35 /DNA_END=540 /DNA_ORIENTATION=+